MFLKYVKTCIQIHKNVIKKSIPSQIQDVNDWYKFYITTYELFE